MAQRTSQRRVQLISSRRRRGQRGLSTVEYVLILVLICAVALASWRVFGQRVQCALIVADQQLAHAFGLATDEAAQRECQGIHQGEQGPAPGGGENPGGAEPGGEPAGGELPPGGETPGAAGCGGASAGGAVPALVGDVLKVMCPQDKAFLADLRARGVQITAYDRIYFEDPYFDGTKWTTKHFEAGGTTNGKQINMLRSSSAEENAATIYHEGVHTGQPDMAWRDKEYDAYTREDAWRISHNLPPHTCLPGNRACLR